MKYYHKLLIFILCHISICVYGQKGNVPNENHLSEQKENLPDLYWIKEKVNMNDLRNSINSINLKIHFSGGFGGCGYTINYLYVTDIKHNIVELKRKKVTQQRWCRNSVLKQELKKKSDFTNSLDVFLDIIENILNNNYTFQIDDFECDSLKNLNSTYDFSNFNLAFNILRYYDVSVDSPSPNFTLILTYNENETIKINGLIDALKHLKHSGPDVDYVAISEWIYNYQLFNYFFPDNYLFNKDVFNKSNLKELLKFYNERNEMEIYHGL